MQKMEFPRGDWHQWINSVLQHLCCGDIQRAANFLACCLGPFHTMGDKHMRRHMFTRPEVKNNSIALWKVMRDEKMITPEAYKNVRRMVQRDGWKLR